MSQANERIPIPAQQRWAYFCKQQMPVVIFGISLVLLAVLWTRRSNQVVLLGQVEAQQVTVTAVSDGVLTGLSQPLGLFDRVEKDVTVLAQLDLSESLAEMRTMIAERDRLSALVAAEEVRLSQQQTQRGWDQSREQRSQKDQLISVRRVNLDSLSRLDDLQRQRSELQQQRRSLSLKQAEAKSNLTAAQAALSSLDQQGIRLQRQVELRIASRFRLSQWKSERSQASQQVADQQELLQMIQDQTQTIVSDLQSLAQSRPDSEVMPDSMAFDNVPSPIDSVVVERANWNNPEDREASLKPLRQAVVVQDSKIQTLSQQLASAEIRSPVSGMVSRVHHPTGAFVQAGDPIVTVASGQPRWIIAYVDPTLTHLVRKNDPVAVRVRSAGVVPIKTAPARVLELGTQFESLPGTTSGISGSSTTPPAVGLPIKISLPAGMTVQPGQWVDVLLAT